MDFLATEQIWGICMFFLGAGVLSLCSRWEREEFQRSQDPRNKYKTRKKNEFVLPKTARGTFMTFTGILLSISGITLVFLYIS